MSVFSPIPLYIHLVQESRDDGQRTCGESGAVGLLLGREPSNKWFWRNDVIAAERAGVGRKEERRRRVNELYPGQQV